MTTHPALWNLELYQTPTVLDAVPLEYRRCPHLPEVKHPQGAHWCMLHFAYMCDDCWQAHFCDCNKRKKQASPEITELEFDNLLVFVEHRRKKLSERMRKAKNGTGGVLPHPHGKRCCPGGRSPV